MAKAKMSYEVRPSKAVTRRLFVDLLRRLGPIALLPDYHYVGFGALEFLDFDLMHRHLGITKMTSIEEDTAGIERYRWNRPFNGISVLPGRASTLLSTLDWAGLAVVWLDYTSTLTTEVISDVETLARVLIPGSVLAVTVNAHPVALDKRRTALEKAITPERVPIGVTDNRLGQWGLAATQHIVLSAVISSAFAGRSDGGTWRQLLNINYQDRARMQMLAGVVSAPAVHRALDQCRFEDLDSVRGGADPLLLHVPLLTQRERGWLNQCLPVPPGEEMPALPGVDAPDIVAYEQVYRYLETAS